MIKFRLWISSLTCLFAMALLGYYFLEKESPHISDIELVGEFFQIEVEKEDSALVMEEVLEEVFQVNFPLNLNTASQEALETLPNIGTQRAQDIILYRENIGGFQNIEEIMEVSGIGEGIFQAIQEFIVVESSDS